MNPIIKGILDNPLPATGPMKRDYDICHCGDFRRDHENGEGKCRMANDINHGYKPCEKFRFSRHSSQEEIDRQMALMTDVESAPSEDAAAPAPAEARAPGRIGRLVNLDQIRADFSKITQWPWRWAV